MSSYVLLINQVLFTFYRNLRPWKENCRGEGMISTRGDRLAAAGGRRDDRNRLLSDSFNNCSTDCVSCSVRVSSLSHSLSIAPLSPPHLIHFLLFFLRGQKGISNRLFRPSFSSLWVSRANYSRGKGGTLHFLSRSAYEGR